MVVGVEVLNDAGTQILTPDSLNSRAVFRARSRPIPRTEVPSHIIDMALPFPYLKDEIPIILIRPDEFGKYIGASRYSTYFPHVDGGNVYGNGSITIGGECPFEMLIFSTKGSPLLRDSGAMFETYDESENIVFSDRFIFPQLRRLIHRPPTPANTGWPMHTNIADLGIIGKPWFMANPIFASGKGVGDFTEDVGSTAMAILADGVTVSTDFRYDGPAENKHLFDPYADRVANFWVASISG